MEKRWLMIFIVGVFLVGLISADVWDGYPQPIWTDSMDAIKTDFRNGGTDVQRTVDAMNDLGATALFKSFGSQDQYNWMINFLEITNDTNIKVWARMGFWLNDTSGDWGCTDWPYRVNNPPYPSGYHNCSIWARHMANLSLKYPNLEAFFIDDLHPFKTGRDDYITPD